MIDNIYIKNFKSLKSVSVDLKPLNVLAGLNGMGKSSFIQSLLLLKQSEDIIQHGQVRLKGSLIDIGKGKDAFYQFAEGDELIEIHVAYGRSQKNDLSLIYSPEADVLNAKDKINQKDQFNLSLQYISAERLGPRWTYDSSQNSISKRSLGRCGEYTAHYLYVHGSRKINPGMSHSSLSGKNDLTLLNQVNAWLGEISPGIRVAVTEVPGANKMLLSYDFELKWGKTPSFKPINVGFGLTFILSVITALLIAQKDDILIIENPEAHIHPRGQAELGSLMALCASNGVQLLVETHSDHILNGVRVAVKEEIVSSSNAQILWFEKITTENEQYTDIKTVLIDKNGELSDYPKDLLDEWANQLLKLV